MSPNRGDYIEVVLAGIDDGRARELDELVRTEQTFPFQKDFGGRPFLVACRAVSGEHDAGEQTYRIRMETLSNPQAPGR